MDGLMKQLNSSIMDLCVLRRFSMGEYLTETSSIDYMNPHIQEKGSRIKEPINR